MSKRITMMMRKKIALVFALLGGLLLCNKASAQLRAQSDLYNVLKGTCSNYLNVTANDSVTFPNLVQLNIFRQPTHGSATVNGKYLSYCSNGSYIGADHFQYTISDSSTTDTATVYINIVNTNTIIFPGDADQNGQVENYDVLALGLAYHLAGPARVDSLSTVSVAWSPSVYLNSNPGASDCNGDGIVDSLDLLAIAGHYGDTTNYSHYHEVDTSLCNDNGIPFYLVSLTGDTVQDGDTMTVSVRLGNTNTNNDAYGIAFSLQFDNGYVPGDGIVFNTASSWMLQNDAGLFFKRSIQYQGEVQVALTKTNHVPANGGGEIARLRVPIDDNIDGIATAPGSHLMKLKLSKVRLTSQYGIVKDICVQQPGFVFNKLASGIDNNKPETIKIYPSPSNGKMEILGDRIRKVELTDILGKVLYTIQTNAANHLSIDLQPLALTNGIYFMKVETRQSSFTKQIIIQQ